MRNSRRVLTCAIAVTLTLAASRGVSTHQLDEYLQAARIGLHPYGATIDLDVTPGSAVAESFIASVDRDRDGVLSADEQRAYADRIVGALTIGVDGRPAPLRLISSTFPDLPAIRRGEGTVRLRASVTVAHLSAGPHQFTFRNAHLSAPGQSAYLANALVPENVRVAVTGQRRDGDQRELTIDYAVHAESTAAASAWILVSLTVVAGLTIRRTRWSRLRS